ncbi:MAG: hypothetical protein K9G59_01735 [Caulobacter sp.]|nr:hypothetical protein [Caulobacter sp.]
MSASPVVVLSAPPMPSFAPAFPSAPALDDGEAVQRLPGDIGYLNPGTLCASGLVEGLMDLADCRALILDLRSHDGGPADALLLGHLAWRPMPMATIRRNGDGSALTCWTGKATAPDGGPHYPDAPLFVLTGKDSPLAAQALAYDLRMAGRAVIISGEDALTLAWRRALSARRVLD